MENDENKTTFTLPSQKVFSIKVGLFLWFCAFLVPKSSTEKCWLWGHGAPPVFNQMTWDQVRRGFFEHVYQPTNPRRNLKNFMCPNGGLRTLKFFCNFFGIFQILTSNGTREALRSKEKLKQCKMGHPSSHCKRSLMDYWQNTDNWQ